MKQFQVLFKFIDRDIVKLYFKTRNFIKIETFQKPIIFLFNFFKLKKHFRRLF